MNRWIGMGRLTKDPTTNNTNSVAKYTLAVDRYGDNTDFISCVAFGKAAEFALNFLKRGTKVVVEGRIQTGSYTNNEGKTVYTTDVVVEHQEFAESKKTETENVQNGFPQINADIDTDDFMKIPEGIAEELPFM